MLSEFLLDENILTIFSWHCLKDLKNLDGEKERLNRFN